MSEHKERVIEEMVNANRLQFAFVAIFAVSFLIHVIAKK